MKGNGARTVRIVAWTTPLLALALALAAGAASPSAPAVGSWAAYQWTSSVTHDVPILVRQEGADGRVTWSVSRESTAPPPIFVTYGIVGGDAKTYTLQIVTSRAVDGPPLSVSQLRVDRVSGKAIRSVTRTPKGVAPTPDDPLRPFRPGDLKGTSESVSVPAGQFTAVRALYRDGTVWVSDQVPATGLVKATFPSGTLELVRSGPAGTKDLLRS
jgi:hypothetical protein